MSARLCVWNRGCVRVHAAHPGLSASPHSCRRAILTCTDSELKAAELVLIQVQKRDFPSATTVYPPLAHTRLTPIPCSRLRSPQACPEAERGALAVTLEPLQRLAERHRGGKEAHARCVATDLLSDFLAVEENFAAGGGGTTEQVGKASAFRPDPFVHWSLFGTLHLRLHATAAVAPCYSLRHPCPTTALRDLISLP